MFHLGRESHLRAHAAAGAEGVLQKTQLWGDAKSSWAVTAPTELLQGHRTGHTDTAPSTTALKKIKILPPKQRQTGTTSIRDGKLREDSPSSFIFRVFSLLEKSRKVIP